MSDFLKLGVLLDADAQRDAIHIAVAPVIAAEPLAPGDHIGFEQFSERTDRVTRRLAGAIGIVDPFLKTRVLTGERFWMFLYPQTITSLRHDWTHPAFAPPTSDSEQWLRAFADEHEIAYESMLDGVARGSVSLGVDISYEKLPEFWRHYERVTGIHHDDDDENTVFRCAC